MKTLIFKIKQALKSKTFWGITMLVVINAVQPIHQLIPTNMLPLTDSLLGVLTALSHLFPSADYTATE